MSTASKVYPSPGGTLGKVRVMVPAEGWTLLAIANELWNTTFRSSMEKVLGSPAADVQLIVAEPPDERFSGVLSVRAEMRGTIRVKAASLKNILRNKTNRKRREQGHACTAKLGSIYNLFREQYVTLFQQIYVHITL